MAERKSMATYESIIRDLKAKKYAPIYILMGDEPYYIDKIADYIAEVGYLGCCSVSTEYYGLVEVTVVGLNDILCNVVGYLVDVVRFVALSCSNSKGSTGIEIA